ncbi:hypothetical protein RB195_018602 [Necator americanus]|uniref:Uncharacterized protein n=1 Tax=Necator americanus TaxID=51031 RepID=A0ABR1CCE6_NECAM
MTTKTIHGNRPFQKPSSLRWTWESPNGGYRDETDHIIVSKRTNYEAHKAQRTPRTIIDWVHFASFVGLCEDTVMDNIDDEYERLVEHFHDCTRKMKSFKTTKRCLSPETLELIRLRGAARAAGNTAHVQALSSQRGDKRKPQRKTSRIVG